MARSGISVSNELKRQFEGASMNGDEGVLKIQIKNEDFAITDRKKTMGSLEADLKQAQGCMQEREACYLIVRSEKKSLVPDDKTMKVEWVMVFYVPEGSMVKDKMLYASSRAGLKFGLGSQKFQEDFFCPTKAECTLKDYEISKKGTASDELLTQDEIIKQEALADAMKAQSGNVRLAAMSEIPIKVAKSATDALQAFKNGNANALLLKLDSTDEILKAEQEAKASVAALANKFGKKDPTFLLFRFDHSHGRENTSCIVFVYHCPDDAKPRDKMFYSSTKSMVVKVIESFDVIVERNLEISDAEKEFTEKSIMDELYPPETTKKGFSKPKRQGKGKARLNAKFNSPSASDEQVDD